MGGEKDRIHGKMECCINEGFFLVDEWPLIGRGDKPHNPSSAKRRSINKTTQYSMTAVLIAVIVKSQVCSYKM